MVSLARDRPKSGPTLYDLAGVVSFSFLAASNLLAISQSMSAGVWSVQITVMGLAVIGLLSQVVRVLGKARTENFLERERAKTTIARENEKFNRESLAVANSELLKSFNEMKSKLNEQDQEINTERLINSQDKDRLLSQLKILSEQLNEALLMLREERDEKRELAERLEQHQAENRSLITQLNSIHSNRIEQVQKQIESNVSDIKEIKKEI